MGRGRVVAQAPQDRYSVLLAKARGEYITQVVLNETLTARHGRHVVSSTLALLTPSLVLGAMEVPTWAAASSRASLLGSVGQAEMRLLSGLPALSSMHCTNLGRLLWQRHTTSRVWGMVGTQRALEPAMVGGRGGIGQ